MKKIEQFQITSLMLSGFKSYEEPTELVFGNPTVITGGNGRGKSSIADAIAFAVTGCPFFGERGIDRLHNENSAGHISNKTLYIALNYEEQAERMNAESAHEIAKELFALECEQRRLTYFIGLLDKRQAEVIRLVFVDGIPTKEVAASFGLTYRTIDRIKRTAIENLAEMYAYSDQFRV